MLIYNRSENGFRTTISFSSNIILNDFFMWFFIRLKNYVKPFFS